MSDLFWVNVRQGLSALGVAAMMYFGVAPEQANAWVTPLVGFLMGLLTWGGSVGWANMVRANTVAVPAATGLRTDVPTVSAATGAVTPATTSR